MMGTYYVGSYWLARQESAEECARRAERFFHLLGRCDPAWTRWHDVADSASAPDVSPDAATFVGMFQRKRNQQLRNGFHFGFWAGNAVKEATAVNVTCGSSSPRVPSVCVLALPDQGLVAERVLTAAVLAEVLRAMVVAWEPEWGVATSYEHQEQVTKHGHADTFVGWVMYFARQRGTVPPLPAPVRVEPVEDKGTLVLLTPERFTVSNPEHVALAARVHEVLEGAGLLGPLQPQGPARAT
jgi:hypothetical protein